MSCLGLCGSEVAVVHLILSLTKPSDVTLSDIPLVLFRLLLSKCFYVKYTLPRAPGQ